MSLRVFVEIPDQTYLQRKGSPEGMPEGALRCSDAGCWLREFKDDEAVERMAAVLSQVRAEIRVYGPRWDNDEIARRLLLAAIGGET